MSTSIATAHPPQPQLSTSQAIPIPPTAMPLIAPSALLQAHLESSPPTRPSGRRPDQPHQIDLNIGSLTHCNGSSVVKIGQTTIICGIRGEILPVSEIPSYNKTESNYGSTGKIVGTERKTNYDPVALYNLVVPNIDLSTGCSPSHAMNTPPAPSTQALTQRLYSLLLSTRLINATDLEIKYTPPKDANFELDPDDPAYVASATVEQTKAFWVLYVDMVCISYGGAGVAFDAAWLAMFAALQDMLLPRAWWDGDLGYALCDPDVNLGSKLNIGYGSIPVPLSFGVFEGELQGEAIKGRGKGRPHWLLSDVDAFEEECCQETGCMVVDASSNGKIVRIEKTGGHILDNAAFGQITKLAYERGKEWNTTLSSALKAKQ